MAERLQVGLQKLDKYLRREDTVPARILSTLSPKKGLAYRTSRRKQVLERTVALPAAIITAPVVGVLAAAVKLEDGGSAFYRQARVGKNGQPVEIVKLRSLHKNADQNMQANITNVHASGSEDDTRSTKIGRFMRRTKLDELPQLWKVVTGELSLFGMRADTDLTFQVMKESRPEDTAKLYDIYVASTPGLVNPVAAFNNRGSSDARYHQNSLYGRKASLGLDLYMAFRTVIKPFLSKKTKDK